MKTCDFLNKLCETLGRQPDSLNLADTMQTVPEWDSMGHLMIIATVDATFHLKASDMDLREFRSLQELTDALKRRQVLED